MENNIYDPFGLVQNYRELAHGKARADAIRYAAEQADLNNDIPYMIFFREEFCEESNWYADNIDIFTVLPELLALSDKYPDAEPVPFQYDDIMDNVLMYYGNMFLSSSEFYQIPLEECIKFSNDYKRRWMAAGHNANRPYRYMASFYRATGHTADAIKAFKNFKGLPLEPCECPGCIANSEIYHYLFATGEKEKADKIAAKIENGTIKCRGAFDNSFSLLRLKSNYLDYYIAHGCYEKAAECAAVLEHSQCNTKEFKPWASIMCAYVYSKPGRAMRIYKKHCQEWEEERNPFTKFFEYKCAACFFKGLQKAKDTVKIHFPASFPLYNTDNIYKISALIEYYYKGAEDIAAKFDQRNGTDKFTNGLGITFKNAGN
ncbi:MAG: hypothetical protein K1W24_03100 [Lachnospiraceae bacterium]